MAKCYICGLKFHPSDGLQVGLFGFVCFNCLSQRLEVPVMPYENGFLSFLKGLVRQVRRGGK